MGMKVDAHASQLARSMRRCMPWPDEAADRALWLRVDISAFLIESLSGSSRAGFPTSAEATRARQLLCQCRDQGVSEQLPLDFLVGASTMLLIQTAITGLAAEALKVAQLLETVLLLYASGPERNQQLPGLPLVHHDCDLEAGTALAADALLGAIAVLCIHTFYAGDAHHNRRAEMLSVVLVDVIKSLLRTGHLLPDHAMYCCMMTTGPLLDKLDDLRPRFEVLQRILSSCSTSSIIHGYFLSQQQYLHFLTGDLAAALQNQALQNQNAQEGVARMYFGAASVAQPGELLSVHADHFVSFLSMTFGLLQIMHGIEEEGVVAMLQEMIARQVNRMALHVPACILADAGMVALAWVAHRRGDDQAVDRCLDCATQVWQMLWLHGTHNLSISYISGMPVAALLMLQRGQPEQAAALVTEFLKYPNWFPADRDRHPLFGICCYVRSQLAAHAGDTAAALRHLDSALVGLRGPHHWLWAECEQARQHALARIGAHE